jgi:spermidine/putrescine-binding protein
VSEILKAAGAEVAALLKQKLELEIKLETINARLKVLQSTTIPEELLVMQVNSAKLSNGVEVALKRSYNGGISYDAGPRAAEILVGAGYTFDWAAAIKIPSNKIDVVRDQVDAVLAANGIAVLKTKPDIHHSTLKKICREMDEKGLLSQETQNELGVVLEISSTVKTGEESPN